LQFDGPHVGCGMHAPPLGKVGPHVSPNSWQFWHDAPPPPHCVGSKPARHVLPTQQPLQFAGPHVGGAVQNPPFGTGVHTSPKAAQFEHCSPNSPHEVGRLPGSQVFPEQHPAQVAPHGEKEHVPLLQVSPSAEQFVQLEPAKPHSFEAVPATHMFPTQQPLQFVGPQPGVSIWH
jgi:hypothetical protein